MSSDIATITTSAAAVNEDLECRARYGVVASCASLLVFCVVAATAGVLKAAAATCFAMAFLGVIGWFVPSCARTRMLGARRAGDDAAGASAGCACHRAGVAATDVPPTFTYDCHDDVGNGAGMPGGSPLCTVCLDVQRGEAVRRLPASDEHLFHKECIDMWLRSHTMCPLCRRDIVQQACAEKSVTAGWRSRHVTCCRRCSISFARFL